MTKIALLITARMFELSTILIDDIPEFPYLVKLRKTMTAESATNPFPPRSL